MPTPEEKIWDDLTDNQKANLKPHEYRRYLEIREEEFIEMARESMEQEIFEAKNNIEKNQKK